MTRRTGPDQATRDAVYSRDRGCIVGGCTDWLQIHHRRPRGMGGTRREDSNGLAALVLVCEEHHAWIESNRETARDRGLLVTQHQTPADVPLVRHGEWVRLTDGGGVVPAEAVA